MTEYNIQVVQEDFNINIDESASYNISLGESFVLSQYTAGDGLDLSGFEFSIQPERLAKIDKITTDGTGTLYLADDGTYKTIPDTGEVNTASNLSGDEGLFAQKNGVDLEFKSLTAGTGIELSSDVNTVTISSNINGLISGGTTGQVLAKIDATDYNVEWVDQTGGGGNPFDQDLNTTDDVLIVPNPYSSANSENVMNFPGNLDDIHFVNLPPYCTLKIYTATGDLIKTMEHTSGSGQEIWKDMRTDANQRPVSGVYILAVDNAKDINNNPLPNRFYKFVIVR